MEGFVLFDQHDEKVRQIWPDSEFYDLFIKHFYSQMKTVFRYFDF